MAWCALIRVWNPVEETYRQLTLRVEDAPEPGCLVRLYDGDSAVGEASGNTPNEAIARAVEIARQYLKDENISPASLSWMEI